TASFTWRTGVQYSIEAKSRDAAGNFALTYSTADFRFDSDAPTSGITLPVSGSTINAFGNISGTANDVTGGTVTLVQVAIRKNSTMLWFNPASGQPDKFDQSDVNSAWLNATGISPWSYGNLPQSQLTA